MDETRQADEKTRESYDLVPYPGSCHPRSHPDRFATLALLHGLAPPPVDACRVLELGCGDGGNLRLETMSLLDLEVDFGVFDYIIVHGVFSWVREPLQEKIFEICDRNLSRDGVAYVSYNTLPGWHLRGLVRDTIRYHSRKEDDPRRQVEMSLELIGLLAESIRGEDDPMAAFLGWAREYLADYLDRPGYLVHEYLEETNTPVYFEDFVARAGRHGLRYLADAEPELNEIGNLPPRVADYLRRFANDRIELEQYMDFARIRPFRWSLLCHEGSVVERRLATETMRRLFASCSARLNAADPDLGSSRSEKFNRPKGPAFSSSSPPAKAVLVALGELWPEAPAFDELRTLATSRLGEASLEPDVLADVLYSLFFAGVLDLHTLRPQVTSKAGEWPTASPFARSQAQGGFLVTNLRHQTLRMDEEVARFLLPHLDGRRDRAALVDLLEAELRASRLNLERHGLEASGERRKALTELVEHQLGKLARFALLVP